MAYTKVLVVEDDPVAHYALVRMLESMGLVTISSSDGVLAWNILKENRDIQLIVSDVVMKDMDGRELLRKIRSEEGLAGLPVILCSAIVSPSEVSEVLQTGKTRFLAKPVTPRTLREALTGVLPGLNSDKGE